MSVMYGGFSESCWFTKGFLCAQPKELPKENTHAQHWKQTSNTRKKKEGKFHLQKVSKHFHLEQTNRSPWGFPNPPPQQRQLKPAPFFSELQKMPLVFLGLHPPHWSSPRGWRRGVSTQISHRVCCFKGINVFI